MQIDTDTVNCIVQFSSVAQSCLTLWDSMDCSMPGLPVHHQLPEFTQTHVHWVGDGQGGLACCDSWSLKELDTTERLNWTDTWNLKKWYQWTHLQNRNISLYSTGNSTQCHVGLDGSGVWGKNEYIYMYGSPSIVIYPDPLKDWIFLEPSRTLHSSPPHPQVQRPLHVFSFLNIFTGV